jgi:AcrR family transcriptional regulator
MIKANQRRIGSDLRHSSAPAPRSNRRERHRLETRDKLYRCALELFGERGFLETTVADITDAADVGKGTFFNYFRTKEHVLAAYGGERIAAVERALEKARSASTPVLEILGELAEDSAGQSHVNPAVLRAIYAAHASCAPVRAELQKRMQTSRELLAEIIVLAQKRGEVRRDVRPIELARMIQTVVIGMTMAWALNPNTPFQTMARQVWDLICPSLRADGTRRKRMRGSSGKV